jgi:hypothetical protein
MQPACRPRKDKCSNDGEKAMKKISLIGAGLMAGGWLFWLGMGLVSGVLIGSAGARRSRLPRRNMRAGNLNL